MAILNLSEVTSRNDAPMPRLPPFYKEENIFFVFYQYLWERFVGKNIEVKLDIKLVCVICMLFVWLLVFLGVFLFVFGCSCFEFGCICICIRLYLGVFVFAFGCIWVYLYLLGRNYTSPNPAGLRREIGSFPSPIVISLKIY